MSTTDSWIRHSFTKKTQKVFLGKKLKRITPKILHVNVYKTKSNRKVVKLPQKRCNIYYTQKILKLDQWVVELSQIGKRKFTATLNEVSSKLKWTIYNDCHRAQEIQTEFERTMLKSLARLTCWWPEIDADIIRIAKSCDKCVHKIHSQCSKWTPWPTLYDIWQRIHADYCGPFLGKFYALVVVDSYSLAWSLFYHSSNCTIHTISSPKTVQSWRCSNGLGNR